MKRMFLVAYVLALAAVGCSDSGGSSACGDGEFEIMPTGQSHYTVTKEVCYVTMQLISDCAIYNYRIAQSEDYSEYLDLHWDSRCQTDHFDGAFEHGGEVHQLSGTIAYPPRTAAAGDADDRHLLVNGSFTTPTKAGSFVLEW